MSSLVGNIVGSIIQCVTSIVFFKEISCLNKDRKKITTRDFKYLIIVSFLISLIYEIEYSAVNPIMSFLAVVFGVIVVYKVDLSRAFICSGLFMIMLFISDMILSTVLVNFFKIETLRGISFYMILANFMVGIILYSLMRVKRIKMQIVKIIETNKNKNNTEIIAFITLFIAAVGIVVFILSKNYTINKIFIMSMLGIFIFIILLVVFLKEKYEKENAISKYDQLFEYVKNFEEWIDTESINIHESKNQLATLRDMIKKNKKAVQYIDNIINERINLESQNVQKLNSIPKGGLKGLLYYKITVAEKAGINLFIDVSSSVENRLLKLNAEDNKTLCRLVGIFFDNAIDAAKETAKKIISYEIYTSEDNLIMLISNTFSGNIELNKVSQNGYSTKGKNRGKGLYLAKKFSRKTESISLDNRIINEYYIQKIIIKGM